MPGQDVKYLAFMRLSRPKWLETGFRQAESLCSDALCACVTGRSGSPKCSSALRRSRAGRVSRR
jgi:hypothetical protein